MKASAATYKDVAKYFHGTYLIVPEVNPQRVFYLQDEGPEGLLLSDTENGEKGYISFSDGFEYTLQSPLATKKQWFQHGASTYLVQRVPARQWQKGISDQNTTIHKLSLSGALQGTCLSAGLLNALLRWEPPQEIKLGPTETLALSSQYAYCGKTSGVFFWDSYVGKIARRTKELFLPKELAELHLPDTLQTMKVKYV